MSAKNQFDAMADYFRSMLTPVGQPPSSSGAADGAFRIPEDTSRKTPSPDGGEPRISREAPEETGAGVLRTFAPGDDGADPGAGIDTPPSAGSGTLRSSGPDEGDGTPRLQSVPESRPEARPVLEQEKSDLTNLARLIEQVKPEVQMETVTETRTETAVQTVTATETATEVKQELAPAAVVTAAPPVTATETAAAQAAQTQAAPGAWTNIDMPEEFQALFFIVHGVTFAVPLIDLGNISNIDRITPIFGKPEWFLGMMNFRDEKFSVVDFVKWAMPNAPDSPEEFAYTIQMKDSSWAITCHELVGTENLTRSRIQWRSTAGKRPWLAGLVKDRMCALIHVEELIKLFEQGVNIEGQKS